MSSMSPKRKRPSGNLTILAMELKSNRLEAILEWMKEASFPFIITAWIFIPIVLGIYNSCAGVEETPKELIKFFLISFAAGPIITGLYWLVYGIIKWRFNRIKAWLLIEEEFDPKAYDRELDEDREETREDNSFLSCCPLVYHPNNFTEVVFKGQTYRIPTSGGQE